MSPILSIYDLVCNLTYVGDFVISLLLLKLDKQVFDMRIQ